MKKCNKKPLKKLTLITLAAFFGIMLIFSGCNIPTPQQLPGDPSPDLNQLLTKIAEENLENNQPELPDETEIVLPAEDTPTPEPTAAPAKLETLTVCLGNEPETLFFYKESSQAMWSVLESIYDGPFDSDNGKEDAVIFEDISIETIPVTVVRGDVIVDFDGDPVELKQGVTFWPAEMKADCNGKDCLSSWTYLSEEAQIMQTVIRFRLKENLKWNDGTPLTAEDSVYSMTVNGMKGINASKRIYNLTESYTALDEYTIEWKGLPGFKPEYPSDVFWIPLPAHIMKGFSAEDLLTSEIVNRTPLGWGAWQIVSWEKGNEIIAERNPYYASSDDSEKPFFDRIVYKFYGRAGDNNLEALRSGTCDIIDTSVNLGADLEPILEDVNSGKESIYIRPELTRQEIVFNLEPAAQQWVTSPLTMSDLRKVIVQGINRKAIIRQVLFGQSEIPVDFYPIDHIDHDTGLEAIAYDPEAAGAALDSMGWTVPEDDPAGPRIASQVSGVMYGTPLSFRLTAADNLFAQKAVDMIRADLAEIGIAVETEALPLGELYAQGPDGIIFGRKFDMVMFAWSAGDSPCSIYLSDAVPSEANHWVGTNVGAYQSEEYDRACLFPESADVDAGKLYADELPAIPLYFNISIGVSSNNICGIDDRIGSRSILWNMEQFSRSETNCAVSQWNDIYH